MHAGGESRVDSNLASSQCPLWVVGSIGRCNTSIKSRSALVSKPKVSPDRSLRCRATRLNCECAPPAVPQLLLGHRVEPSNISSAHRPSTPSLASEIKCCVDRLRPPSKADIGVGPRDVCFTPKSGHRAANSLRRGSAQIRLTALAPVLAIPLNERLNQLCHFDPYANNVLGCS